MPAVSVVIPAFNQSRYLAEAAGSALAQSHRDLEVIVVDDGSTDDTRAVTLGLTDTRVRYVYQENRGLSAARNTGIGHARGEFVSFLDSDDQFLPRKLTALLEVFQRDSTLGFVAGHAVLMDELGEPMREVFARGLPEDSSDLLLGNPLHVGSVLVRREWLDRAGPFDERLRSYEDWDMWLRLALAGCRMKTVPVPVSRYRFHRAQMTRIGDQMTAATFAVLEKTFADPRLPAAWKARRNDAFSRGHLRAAAQSYTAGDFSRAQASLREAVRLDPGLVADDATQIERIAAGWAMHAKTQDPLQFLEGFYDHLPGEVTMLHSRRSDALASLALQLAFLAYNDKNLPSVRKHVRQALAYRPQVLMNRGVMSILVRSWWAGFTRRQSQSGTPPASWSRGHENTCEGKL